MPPKFNFNACRVFLTYPRCTLSQEEVLQSLTTLFPIKEYCIAVEAHQDGTPHVHALLIFERKMHRDNERAFDIEGFHPNIQGIKTAADKERIFKYVCKDGNFLSTITVSKSKRELIADDIFKEGLTFEVVKRHPSIIFLNFGSIQSWSKWIHHRKDSLYVEPSPHKKIHYWIHGPSNCGKTYWLRQLLLTWQGAEIPQNNDYSTLEPDTNLLWYDEYRGHLTIQQLNRLADGYTTLNTKGGSVYLRRSVVVICSNFSIEDIYKNSRPEILETLYNRFYQYDLSINTPSFPKYIINK